MNNSEKGNQKNAAETTQSINPELLEKLRSLVAKITEEARRKEGLEAQEVHRNQWQGVHQELQQKWHSTKNVQKDAKEAQSEDKVDAEEREILYREGHRSRLNKVHQQLQQKWHQNVWKGIQQELQQKWLSGKNTQSENKINEEKELSKDKLQIRNITDPKELMEIRESLNSLKSKQQFETRRIERTLMQDRGKLQDVLKELRGEDIPITNEHTEVSKLPALRFKLSLHQKDLEQKTTPKVKEQRLKSIEEIYKEIYKEKWKVVRQELQEGHSAEDIQPVAKLTKKERFLLLTKKEADQLFHFDKRDHRNKLKEVHKELLFGYHQHNADNMQPIDQENSAVNALSVDLQLPDKVLAEINEQLNADVNKPSGVRKLKF